MRGYLLLAILFAYLPFMIGSSEPIVPAFGKSEATITKVQYRLGDRLPQETSKSGAQADYKEIPWDALVPADWDPMRVFKGIDLNKLNDGDPRAMEALEKLRQEWNSAPVNVSLEGSRVRIPGFVVPLESSKKQITEFLLVPYFGACIHSPPPPANQIIHVKADKPLKDIKAMDPVWVSGTLDAKRSVTGMGDAGYRMSGEVVVPYKNLR